MGIGSVAVYGREARANAEAAGVESDEPFTVPVEADEGPRVVEVPAAALDKAGVRDRWDKLPYSHQREYVKAIEEAKHLGTRERR